MKSLWQDRAAKVTTIFLSLLILSIFISLGILLKDLVKLFVFGLLINYLLSPGTKYLTKLIRVRALAIFINFSVIIVFFLTVGNYIYPIFEEQSQSLGQSIPHIKNQIQEFLINANLATQESTFSQEIIEALDSSNQSNLLLDFISILSNNLGDSSFYHLIANGLFKSINILTEIILTLIISFYLLLDGERLWQLFTGLFPEHYLEHLDQIKHRIDSNLYALVIGQFQLALLTASVMLSTYLLLGSNFAVLLGSLQMLEFIPILGTWTAIIPSILIILTTSGSHKAIIAGTVYLIYTQIIRDQIISPRIMGSAFGIHPLVVVFGLLISIKLFGLVGLVVGLPIIAIASAIMDYLIKFKDKA